jgi:hypothetical protein
MKKYLFFSKTLCLRVVQCCSSGSFLVIEEKGARMLFYYHPNGFSFPVPTVRILRQEKGSRKPSRFSQN